MTKQICNGCEEWAEFTTEYRWGGRKRTKVECLAHAEKSERLGMLTRPILTDEQVASLEEWEAAGIGAD